MTLKYEIFNFKLYFQTKTRAPKKRRIVNLKMKISSLDENNMVVITGGLYYRDISADN